MKIDVFYLCQKDFLFKYLKPLTDKKSFALAFYELVEDTYFNKKIIYNIMPLLKDVGVLCVGCELKNIGEVISLCEQNSYDYNVFFFHSNFDTSKILTFDRNVLIYVLLYGERSCDNGIRLVKMGTDIKNDAVRFLTNLSSVNDIILLIGNSCKHITYFKNMCRNLVCFSNNEGMLKFAENEALTIQEV